MNPNPDDTDDEDVVDADDEDVVSLEPQALLMLLQNVLVDSISHFWPEVDANVISAATGPTTPPSFVCVRGVLLNLQRREGRDGAALPGDRHRRTHAVLTDYQTRVDRVATTAQEIALSDEDEQFVNKPGILVLGLARPPGERVPQQVNCRMLLVGFVPEQHVAAFLPFPTLQAIFCCEGATTAMDVPEAQKHFMAFLEEGEGDDYTQLAVRLREKYPDRRAIHVHEDFGCVVVFEHEAMQSGVYPGSKCSIFVLHPQDFGSMGERSPQFAGVQVVDHHNVDKVQMKYQDMLQKAMNPPKGTQPPLPTPELVASCIVQAIEAVENPDNSGTKRTIDTGMRAGAGSQLPPPSSSQRLLHAVNLLLIDQMECDIVPSSNCYEKIVVDYQLWLLEHKLHELKQREEQVENVEINMMMALLQRTASIVDTFVRRHREECTAPANTQERLTMNPMCEAWKKRMLTVQRQLEDIQLVKRNRLAVRYSMTQNMPENALRTRNSAVVGFSTDMYDTYIAGGVQQPADDSQDAIIAVIAKNSPCVQVDENDVDSVNLSTFLDVFVRKFEALSAPDDSPQTHISASSRLLMRLQLLRDFESFIFAQSADFDLLRRKCYERRTTSQNVAQREASKISNLLVKLAEQYLEASKTFRIDVGDSSWMTHREQQHSREVLVCYVVYCAVFELAKIQFGNQLYADGARRQLRFGVGVRRDALAALLLPTGKLQKVLLDVHVYLEAHNCPRACLFKHVDPTSEFGSLCSTAHSELSSIFSIEIQNRAARLKAHNDEQERRRLEVIRLRGEISTTEREISQLNLHVSIFDERVSGYRRGTNDYRDAVRQFEREYRDIAQIRRDLSDANDRLENLLGQLQEAQKWPEPVIEPLPQTPAPMNSVLFFLHMPETLSNLALMTFMAEASFLPRGGSAKPCPAAFGISSGSKWKTHYDANQMYTYCARHGVRIDIQRAKNNLPVFIQYPAHSELSGRNQRVTQVFPEMKWAIAWDGAERLGFPVNPAGLSMAYLCKDVFVESLPTVADQDSLGWALPIVYGDEGGKETERSRANHALATQDRCPTWLETRGYVTFCTLRAHPFTQLRKFLTWLRERDLPLTDPSVHQLVRQLLFQFGPVYKFHGLGEDSNGREVVENGGFVVVPRNLELVREMLLECHNEKLGVFQLVYRVLNELVDEYREKKRDHLAFIILSEIAEVFVQWHSPCGAVLEVIAEAALTWAEERLAEAGQKPTDSDVMLSSFYLLHSLSAALALPDEKLGEHARLSATLTALLRLRDVLPHDGKDLCGDGDEFAKLRWSFCELHARVRDRLCQRAATLIRAVEGDGAAVSEAARRAGLQLEGPLLDEEELEWARPQELVEGTTNTVFVAQSGEDLLSVNLLTGDLLLNGVPPSRLPEMIRADPLYQRAFGDLDPKVAPTQRGRVFKTLGRSANEPLYEFRMLDHDDAGANFVCVETVSSAAFGKLELELVPPAFLIDQLTSSALLTDLSSRLLELFTYWYCRALGLVFFRSLKADTVRAKETGFLFNDVAYVWNLCDGDSELVLAQNACILVIPPALQSMARVFGVRSPSRPPFEGPEDVDEAESPTAEQEFFEILTDSERKEKFLTSLVANCNVQTQLCLAEEHDVATSRILDVLSKFEVSWGEIG